MARDRNFYFRVKPADEALMFERVDVEAEGLYSKMRRDAFRGEPRGFLVDFRGVPVDLDDLADGYRMTNGRFKARLSELHERQIIQTATEYGAGLRTLHSAWATKKVGAFQELLQRVKGSAGDVYVIPAMLDDVLDGMVGSKTGKDGWEDGEGGRRQRKRRSDPPHKPPQEGTPLGSPNGEPTGETTREPLLPNSYSSELEPKPKQELQSQSPEREREFPTTGARERNLDDPTQRFLRIKVREIRGNAALMSMAINDPHEYEGEIRTLTGYNPDELAEITGDYGILPPARTENDSEIDPETDRNSTEKECGFEELTVS